MAGTEVFHRECVVAGLVERSVGTRTKLERNQALDKVAQITRTRLEQADTIARLEQELARARQQRDTAERECREAHAQNARANQNAREWQRDAESAREELATARRQLAQAAEPEIREIRTAAATPRGARMVASIHADLPPADPPASPSDTKDPTEVRFSLLELDIEE